MISLEVYSTDNKVAADYQIELAVQYLSPIASRSCSISLEITAQDLFFDNISKDEAPKFVEEEAHGKYKPLDDPQADEIENFPAVCVENRERADEDWFIEFPNIEDEKELGKKVTIQVDMGRSG